MILFSAESSLTILENARSNVVRSVNSNMVLAYWLIRREIVQELQEGKERAEYGKRILEKCIDRNGREHELTLENILVVAPYNMQVNLLKRMLPEGARVGTVDKSQGQQAEVVMISMATSSAGYLPHHIDFLYSKNRLNVAISRAKCLAVLVANPALMSIKCSKPEEVALVNSLCWVRDYSDEM